MSPDRQIIHIQPAAPPKPALGAPCNGCGLCCLAEPCPLGMLLSRRRRGACVALRWSAPQGRYLCGAMADPADVLGRWGWWPPVRWWVRRAISAGRGCDAALQVDDSRGS
nr:hypothetical protein [Macromonas nakdongensis]